MEKVIQNIESIFDTPMETIDNSKDRELRISLVFKGAGYSISLNDTYVHLHKDVGTQLPSYMIAALRKDLYKAFNYFRLPVALEEKLLEKVERFDATKYIAHTWSPE